jgi:predicted transposase YbfD/YdcC
VQVALFGRTKEKWLRTFLDLPGGIPSHDTFRRVFSLLEPAEFERCFMAWMAAVVAVCGGKLIAIDGKALRRSFEHAWDRSGMAHLVSAFVTAGGNQMVFGQVAVEDKGNEVVAIPRLLALMDLGGAVVTIDAIGCQRDIAGRVADGGGDYVLPVKDNQPTLLAKVKALADDFVLDQVKGVAGSRVGYHEERDDAHGRVETRRVWVTDEVTWLGEDLLALWPGLKTGSIAVVERVRQDLGDPNGTVTADRHYYITSLGGLDAGRIAGAVRGHWAVENNLHWQLDVTFKEDDRRVRKGHGAENFSRLCRIALNLLKRDTTVKAGIATKRLNAGWDNDYLLQLMSR